MENENYKRFKNFLAILLGVLAIFMIKSIFQNDNSKIVSSKGKKLLSDKDKMKEINKKISKSESVNQEVFV